MGLPHFHPSPLRKEGLFSRVGEEWDQVLGKLIRLDDGQNGGFGV